MLAHMRTPTCPLHGSRSSSKLRRSFTATPPARACAFVQAASRSGQQPLQQKPPFHQQASPPVPQILTLKQAWEWEDSLVAQGMSHAQAQSHMMDLEKSGHWQLDYVALDLKKSDHLINASADRIKKQLNDIDFKLMVCIVLALLLVLIRLPPENFAKTILGIILTRLLGA